MGGITIHLKRFPNIWDDQYGSTRQPSFQFLETLLTLICLSEGLVLLGKPRQQHHYLGESLYESSVVAS